MILKRHQAFSWSQLNVGQRRSSTACMSCAVGGSSPSKLMLNVHASIFQHGSYAKTAVPLPQPAAAAAARPAARIRAAAPIMAAASSNTQQQSSAEKGLRAVVVGGGWAGFGSALALAKAGAEVTLLDAAESPGGLSSTFKSAKGQVVEPGVKGFWYQYANIDALVAELGIPNPFTPFTSSAFWSPEGLQVESPIFQDLVRLPAPLGTLIHTATLFRKLPLADRLSALPLVQALLEHDLDEQLYRQYDAMSAYELFCQAGISKKLYDQFLAPMLLVTLFAPPTELSAAAALGALYYFALAHQPDFDVRWPKGPIGELIFSPLVKKLEALGVSILGGRRVLQVVSKQQQTAYHPQLSGSATITNGVPAGSAVVSAASVVVTSAGGEQQEQYAADVVVLAAGIPALQKLLLSSPVLGAADDLRPLMGLRCTDVLAVRIWLNKKLRLKNVSNVVAGFDKGVGGTFFQLDELQDMYKGCSGSVIEFDLYHAEPLLPLSDDDLIHRLLHTYLAPALMYIDESSSSSSSADRSTLQQQAVTAAGLQVVDSSVLRFRQAVTLFSPGSHDLLPRTATSVPNVYVAGDYVSQGPGSHGCKGLSQEKAYVSGLQAGNMAASFLGLTPAVYVIPVEPDEAHISVAKDLIRSQKQAKQMLAAAGIGGWPFSSADAAMVSRTTSGSMPGPSGQQQQQQLSRKPQEPQPTSAVNTPVRDQSPEMLEKTEELWQLLRDEVTEQVEQQANSQSAG